MYEQYRIGGAGKQRIHLVDPLKIAEGGSRIATMCARLLPMSQIRPEGASNAEYGICGQCARQADLVADREAERVAAQTARDLGRFGITAIEHRCGIAIDRESVPQFKALMERLCEEPA